MFDLGDLREKSFKTALWPKGFFVQLAETGTVTWEQLVAMFFSLNELLLDAVIAELRGRTVYCFQTRIITKTKQLWWLTTERKENSDKVEPSV